MNNEENAVKTVRPVFENSLLSAAVLDSSGEVIYRNKAYEKSLGKDFKITGPLSVSEPQERYISADGVTYKLYSMPVEGCTAVSLFPCSEGCSPYFSSMARRMVSVLTMAADNIAKTKYEDVYYSSLNAIEKTAMELQSQVMISDKIRDVSKADPAEQKAVNISEAVSRFTAELSALTADEPVKISLNARGGLFSKCDTEALTLLMSRFAAELMGGESCPGSVSVELDETCSGRIALTVKGTAKEIVRKKNAPAEELISLMAEVYDCVVTESREGDTAIFRAEMPLCTSEMVMRSPRIFFRDENTDKFSPVNIMLTAYGSKKSYGNKGKEN